VKTTLLLFLLLAQRPLADIAADLAKLAHELATRDLIVVRVGDDLQAAIDRAPAGGTVTIEPGTYVGNFVVRQAVTLRTAGFSMTPGAVQAEDVPLLAHLQTPNNAPALWVPPSVTVADVTLQWLHVSGPGRSLILIGAGDGQQAMQEQAPRRITLTQISVAPTRGAVNGIELHANVADIVQSRIWATDERTDVETHGIVSYNGPGGYRILDNRIHGSHIGIFFGGADPAIAGLIPTDVEIADNVVTKDLTGRVSKNALELKAARRFVIVDNIFDGVPTQSQAGWGIQFTPSQYGRNPDVIIEDIEFARNIVRNVGGVFNILGHGQNQTTGRPTQVSRRIAIRDNWLRCDRALGAHGALMQLGNGPIDLTWERNTVECNGDATIRTSDATPIPGFRFVGNLVAQTGTYGIFFTGGLSRGAGLATRMPGADITGNAFVNAHATFRANLPQNLYLGPADDLIRDGYGIGAAAGYGRRP
jgi:hypothetical protein